MMDLAADDESKITTHPANKITQIQFQSPRFETSRIVDKIWLAMNMNLSGLCHYKDANLKSKRSVHSSDSQLMNSPSSSRKFLPLFENVLRTFRFFRIRPLTTDRVDSRDGAQELARSTAAQNGFCRWNCEIILLASLFVWGGSRSLANREYNTTLNAAPE